MNTRAISVACGLFGLLAIAGPAPADGPRFGVASAPAKPAGAIRVATYNVLNLFDDKDDPALTGRNDDMLSVKPEDEMVQLGKVIHAVDPDVLALQEIESYDVLIAFRDTYLKGMGYDYVVSIDVGQERGIENAVLSRFPIVDHKVWPNLPLGGVHPEKYGTKPNWYAGEPITFRRSPLLVTVEVPSSVTGAEPYELDLFVVHHKSGRFNGYWREAEAKKIVQFINARLADEPGRNILVLGDFNAQLEDESVQMYLDDAGMVDAFDGSDATPEQRTTHGSGRRIDFILLDRSARHELVDGSAFVLGTPQYAPGEDWRNTPAPEGYASDHMPVAIDLLPHDE